MEQKENDRLICLNGEIVRAKDAKISVLATTAQYGINVFEGIRCYLNEDKSQLSAFCLDAHLDRLFNSARLLQFELNENLTKEYLKEQMFNVIKANDYHEDLYVKIGLFLDGESGWSSKGPISFFIQPTPKGRVFTDKNGLDCCVSTWMRINDNAISPRIKAGANYLNSRMAFMEAKANGYDYGIFLNNQQKVSEGFGACIFAVRDGKIVTPSKTSSILESITRDVIINFIKNHFPNDLEEREVDRTELYLSKEIFLVGTSVEILPVVSIDRLDINNREIGELTKSLTMQYSKVVRGTYTEYEKWLTKVQ